ncbi:hypothetical protein A9Q84_00180 [Halobacteriovorax marinus]|uniref:Uncharacterized protein n=1 Tax=Halobacteriovorax marinus TaxID=97084 RepID=A0A1Y5FH53_9BACT|nr:hypothetical protein A9Q84_00180 [Halobacteriovorax marinus]
MYIKHKNELESIKTRLKESEASCIKHAKRGVSEDVSVTIYEKSFSISKSELRQLASRIDGVIKSSISDMCNIREGFTNWFEENKHRSEVTCHHIAKSIVKLDLSDSIIAIIYILEFVIGYKLYIEYLADATISSQIEACVMAAIPLFIGYVLKEILQVVPKVFHYLTYVSTVLSVCTLLYILSIVRSEHGNSSIEQYLSISMLVSCILIGLSVFVCSKDPHLYRDCKKLIKARKKLTDSENDINKISEILNETNCLLNNLDLIKDSAVKEIALSKYLEGLEEASKSIFNLHTISKLAHANIVERKIETIRCGVL